MVDLHFQDIVSINRMIGPDGKYVVGICETCSERYKVVRGEFTHPTLKRLDDTEDGIKFTEFVPRGVDQDFLEYVASMRTWNCCHEGDVPIDGLPEKPDAPRGFTFEEEQ
jgi:hypothetical protein